jgi:hypothetical protein
MLRHTPLRTSKTPDNTIAALCVILLSAVPAFAQTPAPETEVPPADASLPSAASAVPPEPTTLGLVPDQQPGSDSELRLSFSPYLWVTNFSGDISVKGIQIDVSRSFVDILNESDSVFGLMGALDLDYKGFVFQLNGSWVTAKESKQKGVFRNGTVDAQVKLDAVWFEFFGGYRFIDRPLSDAPDAPGRFKLDGFVGGRVTAVDINTTLTASASITLPGGAVLNPGQSVDRSQSNDWVEPLIGFRAICNLDEHWLVQVRCDVGGFGVNDSQFSWQIAAVAGYQWKLDGWSLGVFAGYRALGQDHSSGNLNWDVVTHGALVGVSLSLSF